MQKRNIIITIAATVTAAAMAIIIFSVSMFSSGKGETKPEATTAATATSAPVTTAAAAKPSTAAATTAPKAPTAPATQQTTAAVGSKKQISGFPLIGQLPELPTGCEITSLAMTLNYCGYNADKCDLADNYLTKGEFGKTDPRKAFIGDPRSDGNSRGCYAPVIVDTANRYLQAQGSGKTASDLSGSALEDLFAYIDNNTPVIVWGTMDCATPQYTDTWQIDGQSIQWVRPEHCMVLIGYDDTQVTIADPYYGAVKSFDKATFESCFNALYQQAVVIQ